MNLRTELMNDARTHKIWARSDLQHGVHQIYIYIGKICSKLTYVGLAQAHPNKCVAAH